MKTVKFLTFLLIPVGMLAWIARQSTRTTAAEQQLADAQRQSAALRLRLSEAETRAGRSRQQLNGLIASPRQIPPASVAPNPTPAASAPIRPAEAAAIKAYLAFASQQKLAPEQFEGLVKILMDGTTESARLTAAQTEATKLGTPIPPDEIRRRQTEAGARTTAALGELLGPEGYAAFKEYDAVRAFSRALSLQVQPHLLKNSAPLTPEQAARLAHDAYLGKAATAGGIRIPEEVLAAADYLSPGQLETIRDVVRYNQRAQGAK